jgi:O-antigen ligase
LILRRNAHRHRSLLLFVALTMVAASAGVTIANGNLFSFRTALILALLVFLGFLLNPQRWFWVIPVAIVLTPLKLGDFAGAPDLSGKEIMVPLFLLALLVRLFAKKGSIDVLSPRHNTLSFFIFFFFAVVFANYLRHPLMPANLLGLGSEVGGFRSYYEYFLGIGAYILILYYGYKYKKVLYNTIRLLLFLSTVMCVIGISMYIGEFSFFGIQSLVWSVHEYSYGAVRIGFIGTFGQLGLLLLLSNAFSFRWRFGRYLLGLLFITSLFLSGGRAVLVGSLAAVAGWLFLRRRYLLVTCTTIAMVAGYLSLSMITSSVWHPQLLRLTNVSSLQEGDISRYYTYQYAIADFLDHPLFGTGLGESPDIPAELLGRYPTLETNLRMGGHATYAAILKNFGLVGTVPYLAILIIAFVACFKAANRGVFDSMRDLNLRRIPQVAVFLGSYVVAYSVQTIAGGHAASTLFYFLIGMVGVMMSLGNAVTEGSQEYPPERT